MQSTLALPVKSDKISQRNDKRHSKSGSFAYDIMSDHDHKDLDDINTVSNNLNRKQVKIDDWKKMQNIRVIARFRPKNKREARWSRVNNIEDKPPQFISPQSVSLEPSLSSSTTSTSTKSRRDGHLSIDFNNRSFTCTLDAVLTEQCTQKQVFYRCGLPMIMACLDGYNATIFAYGQSGSGKTYTMMGPENNVKSADDFGLVPRCIIYLFQKLDESLSNNGGKLQDYIINMELLQIYKSQLLDLLNPKCKKKLIIKTNFTNNNVFVQNLRSVEIQTVEEAFKLLTSAQQNRIVAGHSLNEVSSRSHMLITMTVIQRYIDGTLKTSKLNFADLAGSEDLTKALGSNPDKERKKEAIAINQSLSALTTAVSYLSRGQKPGFRDSPLTHILKDSLGGNSKTIMLVTVSPHIYNRGETIRTLRFASTAKKVKNKAKINEEKSIVALKKRIKELERENGKLREKLISAKQTNKLHHKSESKNKVNGITKRYKKKDSAVEIKETDDDDRASVILHSDGEHDVSFETDQKTSEIANHKASDNKRRGSVEIDNGENGSSAGSFHHDIHEDEWGSDTEDDNNNISNELSRDHLHNKNSDNSDSEDEDSSSFELNEYIHQLNEYREKLDRESEENEELQLKIDEQNLELESCANKIAELTDEVNQNEQDFYDSKSKIRHLHSIIAQYQQQYPSFQPDIPSGFTTTASPSPLPQMMLNNTRRSTISLSSRSGNSNGHQTPTLVAMPDDYDIVPDLMTTNNLGNRRSSNINNNRLSICSRPSLSRQDTFLHQTSLLENLLSLHQRMESKMKETECALNELRNASNQSPQPPIPPLTSLQLLASNSLQPITSNHSTQINELQNVAEHSPLPINIDTIDVGDRLSIIDANDMDASSTLVYESADEKLSEWDLDVSTGRDSEVLTNQSNRSRVSDNNHIKTPSYYKSSKSNKDGKLTLSPSPSLEKIKNNNERSPSLEKIKNSKQLRQHLRSLSKNEKKLKKEVTKKLKEEAAASSGWCQCFFTGVQRDNKADGVTSQLIEEYLKTQVRKELVIGKYKRNKKRNRSKTNLKLKQKQKTVAYD